jgi:hypothetical protein
MVIFLLLLLLAGPATAEAPVEATASVESSRILIGDQVRLRLQVVHPAGAKVVWPHVSSRLGDFEVIRVEPPVTRATSSGELSTMTVVLIGFDPGTRSIPSLTIGWIPAAGGSPQALSTRPLSMNVREIKVNASGDIRDIKPPLSVPLSWKEILPYAAAAVAGILLLYAIIYIGRKRRRGERILPAAPARPPRETALEELRALQAEHMWQSGRIKEYHTRLTEILRTYIERQFGVIALEMPSEEILAGLRKAGLSGDAVDRLGSIFRCADLVKFAKHMPIPEQNESSMTLAFAFLESSVQESQPEPLQPAEVSL